MRFLKVALLCNALAVLAALSLAGAAQAQVAVDKPLFDWSRLSFAGGINYVWYAAPVGASAPIPLFDKEWEAGLYGAYNLTPHLSVAGSTVYGFDNKNIQDRIGLRVKFGGGE